MSVRSRFRAGLPRDTSFTPSGRRLHHTTTAAREQPKRGNAPARVIVADRGRRRATARVRSRVTKAVAVGLHRTQAGAGQSQRRTEARYSAYSSPNRLVRYAPRANPQGAGASAVPDPAEQLHTWMISVDGSRCRAFRFPTGIVLVVLAGTVLVSTLNQRVRSSSLRRPHFKSAYPLAIPRTASA